MEARAGSLLSAAIVRIGSVLPLFKSKITKGGLSDAGLVEDLLRRSRERELDAGLLRGRPNLGAEQKVVNGDKNHMWEF